MKFRRRWNHRVAYEDISLSPFPFLMMSDCIVEYLEEARLERSDLFEQEDGQRRINTTGGSSLEFRALLDTAEQNANFITHRPRFLSYTGMSAGTLLVYMCGSSPLLRRLCSGGVVGWTDGVECATMTKE